MDQLKDIQSGRFIIDKGTSIEGGIWEGRDGIRTFVDISIGKQLRLREFIEKYVHPLVKSGKGVLSRIPEMARSLIPINDEKYQEMIKDPEKLDRYGLESFFSNEKDNVEVGGGGFDQQALLAGLLMEEYYRIKYPKLSMTRLLGNSPKVGISRNQRGYAVVDVMTRSGDKYKFDPSERHTEFVRLEK